MKDTFEVKYKKIPVEVSIKGNDKTGFFTLIIDTGASHSILDKNIIKSLGYNTTDCFKTETLKGFGGNSIKIPFLKVKSVDFLGCTRKNFEIGLLDFSPNMFYDGILGIDFFINHKLSLDFKNGIIELE